MKLFLVSIILGLSLITNLCLAKSAKEIYRDYKNSVLLVVSEEEDGQISTGTAFSIDEDGIFITAAHVILDAEKTILVTRDKQSYPVQQTLWIDTDADLAIIKIAKKGFKPVPLMSYKAVEVGERLTVVSFPKGNEAGGLESTLSEGLLSSVRESFISERIGKESPSYDKENPKILKSEAFYKNLKSDCKLSKEKSKPDFKMYKCTGDKKVLLDTKTQTVLYENYDIAIKKGSLIYFYENTNRSLYAPVKMVGAMLQYTSPISVGSSGGPIFNEAGEVIAVVNSYLDDAQNINFGRPIDYLPQEYLNKNHLATVNLQEIKTAKSQSYSDKAIQKVYMKTVED